DGDDILRDLAVAVAAEGGGGSAEADEAVRRILGVSYGNGHGHGGGGGRGASGAANLELERILREADVDDDHDEDDDDERDACAEGRRRHPSPASRGGGADLLLQSILDEDDEEGEEDEGLGMAPRSASGRPVQKRGDSTSAMLGGIRRLSSLSQPSVAGGVAPMTHAMEVDAILNSVPDDDDDIDDDETDMSSLLRDYQRQPSSMSSRDYGHRRGPSAVSLGSVRADDGTDEEDDTEIGLNINFSSGAPMNGLTPRGDARFDERASLQFPLRRREGERSPTNGQSRDGEVKLLGVEEDVGRVDDDREEEREDRTSELRLQRAEARERRLLRPSPRGVVSPLGVKRRMRPKVELMTKSRMGDGDRERRRPAPQGPRFGFSGGIVRSRSLSTLGSQLWDDPGGRGECPPGGLPTALAVNSRFIAVGNQRGEIRVFDLFEQLKIILGENSASAEGPRNAGGRGVTSIDLSPHGDFLLAGYGSGHVALWDIIGGKILKQIVDLHASSISSARFTCVPTAAGGGGGSNNVGAVSVDASGLVNKLTFVRGMLWSSTYSVETECLLDGTAGQILAMDALPPLDPASRLVERGRRGRGGGQEPPDRHPSADKIVLIALSSARSSFAVSVEPRVSVLHKWARPPTEQIDPSIAEEDRLTQVTYAPSHAASSYASSCGSTSTYLSNASEGKPTPEPPPIPVPYLPCLSWGWALVPGGGHTVAPVLARAWGHALQFLRASFPPVDEGGALDEDDVHWPAFGTHDELDAAAPVVALEWLGRRSLVYLTLSNEFAIIDTVIMTMQERLDFSGMRLVYAEFALSRAKQKRDDDGARTTFMNSIRSSDDRLLVLCREGITEITVPGMRRQISSLEDGGQWLEALALALDHYESTIQSQEDGQRDASGSKRLSDAVVTMVSGPDESLLTDDEIWMAELLMRYLTLAIENAPEPSPEEFGISSGELPDRLDLAESHFEMLSGVCIEFCTVTRRLDLLFGPIFRRFYDARFINVFLDVMETYVLNDRLKYVAPEAMALFVSHCRDLKELSTVERCLLHMDCGLMDYDSILGLLRQNGLYTGLLHVYSSGLDDYVSPLEALLEAAFDAADGVDGEGGQEDGALGGIFEQYGYKAILYLRYCFQGKAFPKGDGIFPEERVQTLREELFDLLFRETANPSRHSHSQYQNRNSSLSGIRASSYPYLHALILTDAKAFLDCLKIVLDDPQAVFAGSSNQIMMEPYEVEYETDDAVRQFSQLDSDETENDGQLLPNRQHLANVLSSVIMTNSLVDSLYHFGSRKQMTSLAVKAKHFFLDFLAKYLREGVITLSKYLTGEVFIRLCNKRGASEGDIVSLLQAIPRNSYELEEILFTVERVQFSRAALFLHKLGVTMSVARDGMLDECQYHFSRSIDCYLKDMCEDFRKGVFTYCRKECSGGNVSMLRNVVLRRLPELVELDAVNTAHLAGDLFIEDIDLILSSLNGIESGRVEYSFLHAIISGELDKLDTVAAQELLANLTINHHHSYLLLMAKFQPDNVYQYLSTHNNYRLNDALKLCQERKITDASAYLLERMGDVPGALKLMLEALDERIIRLADTLRHSGFTPHLTRDSKFTVDQNEEAGKEVAQIKQILSAVLDLCERNKNDTLTLDNERGPLLWFHVLDRLVNAKSLPRISKDSTDHTSAAISNVLSELLLMTMQRMISNVSLFEIMHKITVDHAGNDLGEFREMLVSMLKTYSSELDVCSSAVDVMYYDIRVMSYEKKKLKVRGCFVKESPKRIPQNSFAEVGPNGNCDVTSHHHAYTNNGQFSSSRRIAPSANAASLRHRRRSKRHHALRTSNRIRQSSKSLNLMTAAEYQFSSLTGAGAQHAFGVRQIAGLSEAQNAGVLK
ncbi:hypothetical protein ACHAWF_015556, partial [Thalassiosira exigua]